MANEKKKLTVGERQDKIADLTKQKDKFLYGALLENLAKTRADQTNAIKHGREHPEDIQAIEITIKRGHKKKSEDDFKWESSTIQLVKDDTTLIGKVNTGNLEEFGEVISKTVMPDNAANHGVTNVVALWNALEDCLENIASGQNNKAIHLLSSQSRFQNAKRMWENHIKHEPVNNPKERLEVVLFELKGHEDFFAKIEAAAANM